MVKVQDTVIQHRQEPIHRLVWQAKGRRTGLGREFDHLDLSFNGDWRLCENETGGTENLHQCHQWNAKL